VAALSKGAKRRAAFDDVASYQKRSPKSNLEELEKIGRASL
jgi:hypothetical protein